jgi:hypothetical protein
MPRPALRRLRMSLTALLVLGAGLALAEPARAADNGEWAVVPTGEGGITSRTSFAFDIEPGTTVRDSVKVQNLTEETMRFRVYPADAFNPSTGGISVESPDKPVEDAASWITLATNEVEIPKGHEATIEFTLAVPADATPGDHAAGIAALNLDTETEQGDGSVQVDVQRSVALPMFVRVAGPLQPSLAVSDVSVSPDRGALPWGDRTTTVQLTITNNGNVRLSPEVAASLDGWWSGGDFDPATLDNLLPGASQTATLVYDGSPFIGPASVDLTVTAEGVTIRRSESFWAIPWLLLLLVLAVVLAVIVLRRRRRSRSNPPVDEPSAGLVASRS